MPAVHAVRRTSQAVLDFVGFQSVSRTRGLLRYPEEIVGMQGRQPAVALNLRRGLPGVVVPALITFNFQAIGA